MSYSKAISWIDDCRIPFVDDKDIEKCIGGNGSIFNTNQIGKGVKIIPNTQGRFPANILVSDDMLNDGSIKKGREKYPDKNLLPMDYYGGLKKEYPTEVKQTKDGYTDKGTNSRYYDIDKWFDKILNN